MNALMKLYYGTISRGINNKPVIVSPGLQDCAAPLKVKKPKPFILSEGFKETLQVFESSVKGNPEATKKTVGKGRQTATGTKQAPELSQLVEAAGPNGSKFLSSGDVALFNSISNKPKPKKHIEDSQINIQNHNGTFPGKASFNLYRSVTKFTNPFKKNKNE